MRHYTAQLRSVDEGTTVFFYCEKCGYKWVYSYAIAEALFDMGSADSIPTTEQVHVAFGSLLLYSYTQ